MSDKGHTRYSWIHERHIERERDMTNKVSNVLWPHADDQLTDLAADQLPQIIKEAHNANNS